MTGGQIGAKTGTTNNNSDGWFIGFTPQLVSGCWVGGEERDIHFDSMSMGQGATMALPIWAIFMKKIYADPSLGIRLPVYLSISFRFGNTLYCPISWVISGTGKPSIALEKSLLKLAG